MAPSIFDGASMAGTVLRVRDVDASVGWYREKLGLEAIHIGADGPEHPFASFSIAGSIVSCGNSHPAMCMPSTPTTPAPTWWLSRTQILSLSVARWPPMT
jgi:catechol 2,3-dioxygenase-like lactoylglutathione lyase family enzyme